MRHNIDYSVANSSQIAEALGGQLAEIRLSQNRTQAQIAEEAGISRATLVRLEHGHGVSLDSFIRVIMALKLHMMADVVVTEPSIAIL